MVVAVVVLLVELLIVVFTYTINLALSELYVQFFDILHSNILKMLHVSGRVAEDKCQPDLVDHWKALLKFRLARKKINEDICILILP